MHTRKAVKRRRLLPLPQQHNTPPAGANGVCDHFFKWIYPNRFATASQFTTFHQAAR